jgi:hypothetical protein
MDRREYIKKMEYLKWLIDKKATGKPKDVAATLCISERTLYRLMNDLKEIYGLEITYSNSINSYIIHSIDQNDRLS